jgi:hypothetical protein
METAWCPTCRTRREVMDTYATDTGDSRVPQVDYTAQPLECGHDASDGGATPPAARRVNDAALVAQVSALQQHAR